MTRKLFCEVHYYESDSKDASEKAFNTKEYLEKENFREATIERRPEYINADNTSYEYVVTCYDLHYNQWEL